VFAVHANGVNPVLHVVVTNTVQDGHKGNLRCRGFNEKSTTIHSEIWRNGFFITTLNYRNEPIFGVPHTVQDGDKGNLLDGFFSGCPNHELG
jgi:hypothetical protein